MEIPDSELKGANRRLVFILTVFALALTALVIYLMHLRSEHIYQDKIKASMPTSCLDRKDFCC